MPENRIGASAAHPLEFIGASTSGQDVPAMSLPSVATARPAASACPPRSIGSQAAPVLPAHWAAARDRAMETILRAGGDPQDDAHMVAYIDAISPADPRDGSGPVMDEAEASQMLRAQFASTPAQPPVAAAPAGNPAPNRAGLPPCFVTAPGRRNMDPEWGARFVARIFGDPPAAATARGSAPAPRPAPRPATAAPAVPRAAAPRPTTASRSGVTVERQCDVEFLNGRYANAAAASGARRPDRGAARRNAFVERQCRVEFFDGKYSTPAPGRRDPQSGVQTDGAE